MVQFTSGHLFNWGGIILLELVHYYLRVSSANSAVLLPPENLLGDTLHLRNYWPIKHQGISLLQKITTRETILLFLAMSFKIVEHLLEFTLTWNPRRYCCVIVLYHACIYIHLVVVIYILVDVLRLF